MHRRRALRASFVITLGGLASCRSTRAVEPAPSLSPAAIRPANDGRCLYQEPMGACPAGAMCNPPPLLDIDCPDAAVVAPNEHPGWLRVRPGLYVATPTSCEFHPERWCPPAGSTEACEPSHAVTVPCTSAGEQITVPAFAFAAGTGRCARLAAFQCSSRVGACVVPEATAAPCDAATLR